MVREEDGDAVCEHCGALATAQLSPAPRAAAATTTTGGRAVNSVFGVVGGAHDG